MLQLLFQPLLPPSPPLPPPPPPPPGMNQEFPGPMDGKKEKVVIPEMIANIYSDETLHEIVSDVTAGNVLGVNWNLPIGLPGCITGWPKRVLPIENAVTLRTMEKYPQDGAIMPLITDSPKIMMGSPYLWGGTSPKEMGLSVGVPKPFIFLNGMVIPRDAYEQMNERVNYGIRTRTWV